MTKRVHGKCANPKCNNYGCYDIEKRHGLCPFCYRKQQFINTVETRIEKHFKKCKIQNCQELISKNTTCDVCIIHRGGKILA